MRVACAAASSGVLLNALFGAMSPCAASNASKAALPRFLRPSARLIDGADAAPHRRCIAHETLQRPHRFGQAVDEGRRCRFWNFRLMSEAFCAIRPNARIGLSVEANTLRKGSGSYGSPGLTGISPAP